MTINEKELWRSYREAVRIWFKAMRRLIAAELYYFLSKFGHSISAFYIVIAAASSGKGKVKDAVYRRAVKKACEWLRFTLEKQYCYSIRIYEGKELIAEAREILAKLKEEIHVKETA